MKNLEKMEKRWLELVGKPRTKQEVSETLLLAKKLELERTKEYRGLIKELDKIGVKINSIWDLVNSKIKYPLAIPILLKYLPIVEHDKNKEGIIRALTVKEAKGKANKVLLNEYFKIPKEKNNLKWVIGNAMSVVVVDTDIEDIISIVLDKENDISRQMFILALGKIKSDKSKIEDVLIKLLDDEEVLPHVLSVLGKLKSQKAKEKITSLLNHSVSLVRKEAQKALKKIT